MPTPPFRVGIVGAGLIARDHALCLSHLPAVAGMSFFDTQTERAEQLAGEFKGSVHNSLEALAEESDIVWVCTPPFVRREPITAACQAGKPIFCEKPLALSRDDAAFVKQAVQEAGVTFFMGQSNRFLTVFRKIKELLDSGAIGKPLQFWSTRLGWLDPAVAPPWRLEDDKGGGVIVELGIHEIDYTRWTGGEWKNVYARGTSEILAPGRFEEAFSVMGEMENGATARIDISWASPRYLWQRGIEGTQGSIFFDDSRIREVELHRPGKDPEKFAVENWQDEATGENTSLRNQACEVLDTLAHGGQPPVTLHDGVAGLGIALAIRESARTGKIVPCEAAA